MHSSNNRNAFRVKQNWNGAFPYFKKPDIIGYWSLDGCRRVCYDVSQLHYYSAERNKNKEVEFDLSHGIDIVERKPENLDERIYHLLEWIKNNYNKIRANPETGRWIEPDFICYRGLLTKIMKSPYEYREGWIICAAKWKGTIYLCEYKTEKAKIDIANETPRQKLMTSWGHKFEQYIVTDSPDELPDTSKPVVESEEFCCVFQTRLTQNSLLFGAEMDGLCSAEKLEDPLPLDKLKFVELKTSRIPDNDRQVTTLERHKFLSWWCQSFLVGIQNILCGFRDDSGIVRYLENFDIFDIARRSQAKRYWSGAAAMNCCDNFLKHIAKNVVNDCDRTLYKFERIPNADVLMTELPPTSEYAFLPSWYTQLSS